jgi:hypothetical protein
VAAPTFHRHSHGGTGAPLESCVGELLQIDGCLAWSWIDQYIGSGPVLTSTHPLCTSELLWRTPGWCGLGTSQSSESTQSCRRYSTNSVQRASSLSMPLVAFREKWLHTIMAHSCLVATWLPRLSHQHTEACNIQKAAAAHSHTVTLLQSQPWYACPDVPRKM